MRHRTRPPGCARGGVGWRRQLDLLSKCCTRSSTRGCVGTREELPRKPLFLTRDRWFESGSLQRGVCCEPVFLDRGSCVTMPCANPRQGADARATQPATTCSTGFRAGEDALHAIEAAELGDISGKRVL